MENLLKTGSSSIILGSKYYDGYFPIKCNKLLKITKILNNHDETKYLDTIREIKDYDKYYSIPDNEINILLKDSEFYNKIKKLTKEEINIFTSDLEIMYIDCAGIMDILDSLNYLTINHKSNIWINIDSIINFTKQLVEGLKFLHENNLCHLDVKPENIMINYSNGQNMFKLIDFGYCSKYPFEDYINNIRGTPGYFPSHYKNIDYMMPGLPKIIANDMQKVNGAIKMSLNRNLVYKIDSYCLGRVIHLIFYHYLENYEQMCCFDTEYNKKTKLINIKNLLLEKDVEKRINIISLYNKYII